MRLRLARKLEMRMLWAAVTFMHDERYPKASVRTWIGLTKEEKRDRLTAMLAVARVRRQTWRRALRRVWQWETR